MTEGKVPDDQYIERPFDPDRKRYYVVDTDVRRSYGDFELLNEEDVFIDGQWGRGRQALRIPAGRNLEGWDVSNECFYGLPPLLAKPRLKVGIRNKPNDVYGDISLGNP